MGSAFSCLFKKTRIGPKKGDTNTMHHFMAGDDRISTLTEKQKEQFEAYMSAQREVNVLTEGKMREI